MSVMQEYNNKYALDISDLYLIYCSELSVCKVAEYIGGVNRLVELCCYVALSNVNHGESDVHTSTVKRLNIPETDLIMIQLITNVVCKFSELLRTNFILPLMSLDGYRLINHIQIKHAEIRKPRMTYNDISPCTSLHILTNIYWYIGDINELRTRSISKYECR